MNNFNTIFFIFLIVILYYFVHKSQNENFKIQYLSPINKILNDTKKNNKQLPWCQKWNHNKKTSYRCYINKHLQRKCIWEC